MGILVAMILAGGGSPLEPAGLYDFADLQEVEDQAVYVGFQAFGLWTRFDTGLRIEDAEGLGADFRLSLVGTDLVDFRFGFAGWNTGNDEDVLEPAGVRVRQYRAGLGFEVPLRRPLEVGFWVLGGVCRFRRDGENDTSPYLEFMGSVGLRPVPAVWIGIVGMATHTQSSFNHEHTHLYHNYSAGPAVEIRY